MATPVHRLQRAAFFFATYGALAALSLWFAYELRFAGPEVLSGVEGTAAEAYLYVQRPLVLDVWANEPEPDLRLIPYTDIASAHIAGHSIEGKARGTEMLYQAFCQQLGLTPAKTLAQVLPEPQISEVKINSNFGLLDVQNLTRLLYDVRRDDALFRFYMMQDNKTQGFDWLRKSYPPRREYSSVRLTGQEVPEFLTTLGFNTQIN